MSQGLLNRWRKRGRLLADPTAGQAVLVDAAQTRDFASRLMERVWGRFDSSAVPDFYHRDVVGHHENAKGWTTLGYDDVVHRIDWDKTNFGNPEFRIDDLIAGENRFAMRFQFSATLADGERFESGAGYFYHLRDGKISEFWLFADVDFDYKE